MTTSFFTNLSEEELKNCIKDTVKEALKELSPSERTDYPDRLFSISEASQFTYLAKQTLYGLTSRREIPFIKKGKKLYFKKSELLTWLESGKKFTKSEIGTRIDNFQKK